MLLCVWEFVLQEVKWLIVSYSRMECQTCVTSKKNNNFSFSFLIPGGVVCDILNIICHFLVQYQCGFAHLCACSGVQMPIVWEVYRG